MNRKLQLRMLRAMKRSHKLQKLSYLINAARNWGPEETAFREARIVSRRIDYIITNALDSISKGDIKKAEGWATRLVNAFEDGRKQAEEVEGTFIDRRQSPRRESPRPRTPLSRSDNKMTRVDGPVTQLPRPSTQVPSSALHNTDDMVRF